MMSEKCSLQREQACQFQTFEHPIFLTVGKHWLPVV